MAEAHLGFRFKLQGLKFRCPKMSADARRCTQMSANTGGARPGAACSPIWSHAHTFSHRTPPPFQLITPARPQTRAAVESNDAGAPPDARPHQQDDTTSCASISEAAVVKPEEENISRTTRIMRRVVVNHLVNRRNPLGQKILKNKEISEWIGIPRIFEEYYNRP